MVIHYTKQEMENAKEYGVDPFTYGSKVKTRTQNECIYSGDIIKKGMYAHVQVVFPNSTLGKCLDLDKKPHRYYACGICMECTH